MKIKVLFISICFLLLLSPVSVFAMDMTWTPESINALGDLGYGLAGGASLDFDGAEKYQIDGWLNMSAAEKDVALRSKAAEALRDYCILRGLPLPDDWSNPDLSNPGMYATTFFNRESQLIYQKTQLANSQLEIDEALRFTLNRDSFSDWIKYNEFWYQKYLKTETSDPDTPSPEIPSDVQSLVNDFAYQSFRISEVPNHWGTVYIDGDFSDYTLVSNVNLIYPYTDGPIYFYCADKANIYITGSDDNYTLTYTPSYVYPAHFEANPTLSQEIYYPNATFYIPEDNSAFGFLSNTQDTKPASFSYSGNLLYILTSINYRFFNFNLYVNGVLWYGEAVDIPGEEPLIPDFPDIFNPDTSDPAYDIVLPGTESYDGTFDITSIFDALKEAIAGAQDNDSSTSSVLDKSAVRDSLRDRTGELTQAASIPIAQVLTDAFPVQNTQRYPDLPILNEPIHNAFVGTTILAQLIDATQTALPQELIVVFWGIVFILFIIGLIKIFHTGG